MIVQITLLMDNAHKFIWKAYDEPISSYIYSYMMNPDEDHHEHNNILMFRMFTQIFK